MRLLVIFGPAAVGKMTVGFELQRLTGLRLFHNHMAVDPVLRFFPFGTPPFNRLVREFRTRIFEEVSASDLPGLIFTYTWALNEASDKKAVDRLVAIFEARGADIGFVELEATQQERLRRNETPLRLAHKEPKRNVEHSRGLLLEHDAKYRFNSRGDFFYPEHHLKIENTSIAPDEAARRIADHFAIPRI